MTGKCELCPAVDVPLGRTYKARDLGASLCSCCRMKVFNILERQAHAPPGDFIGEAFARMSRVSSFRRAQRDAAPSPARSSVTAPLLTVRRLRGASWAAHSVPDER